MPSTWGLSLIIAVMAWVMIIPVAAEQSERPSEATEAATKPETEHRPPVRPGMMLGPGVITARMRGNLCGSGAAGFTQWRIAGVEKAVKPTDAQRVHFENLKTASAKAAEMVRDTCSHDIPNTPTGRMEALDKRLDAMLSAVRTVRPALEAFYGSLSDEQKAGFNSMIRTRTEH